MNIDFAIKCYIIERECDKIAITVSDKTLEYDTSIKIFHYDINTSDVADFLMHIIYLDQPIYAYT